MTDAVAERYARFARSEAPGRSEVYRRWAELVVADEAVRAVLARIPETHRQPPLVFAVSRLLGAADGDAADWRAFVLAHADALVAECARRRLQTNEPQRAAALLPALAAIDGPIALLEIGASAGICLYPDRYSYRFVDAEGMLRGALDPVDGPSPVVLTAEARGAMPRVRMPQIVWRAGIDLDPLDARREADRRWLRTLAWPGERGRTERIDAALDVVAAEPPLLVPGDAVAVLDEIADRAPAGATLVISTPGVLVHIPRPARAALVSGIRSRDARWVTIDPTGLPEVWHPDLDTAAWPGFALGLDGRALAAVDPLGAWWEWRAVADGAAT